MCIMKVLSSKVLSITPNLMEQEQDKKNCHFSLVQTVNAVHLLGDICFAKCLTEISNLL